MVLTPDRLAQPQNWKRAGAESADSADMRLKERTIKQIEPPPKGYAITWDEELKGLGLRTTAAGAKAFVYNFRNASGQQRRITIGKWPAISATAARGRARDFAIQVHLGEDPLADKETKRTALTAGKLVELFVAGGKFNSNTYNGHLPDKKRGWEWELYLRRDFLPRVGANTKAEDVKRRDVVGMLNAKAATAPVAANRLLEVVRRLYSWGLKQALVETTPCVNIDRPTEEKSRDRVLSAQEIATFWERLDTASRMSQGVRVALKLVLVTGQRPGEVCAMEWKDLDLDGGWWDLPDAKTKSKRKHYVPLTSLALELLLTRPRGDQWVFPSVKGSSLKAMALSHAVRHNRERFRIDNFGGFRREEEVGVGVGEWFRPHDLRPLVLYTSCGLRCRRVCYRASAQPRDSRRQGGLQPA